MHLSNLIAYQYDVRFLSAGRVVEHRPTLDHVGSRYAKALRLRHADEPDIEVDGYFWPAATEEEWDEDDKDDLYDTDDEVSIGAGFSDFRSRHCCGCS